MGEGHLCFVWGTCTRYFLNGGGISVVGEGLDGIGTPSLPPTLKAPGNKVILYDTFKTNMSESSNEPEK